MYVVWRLPIFQEDEGRRELLGSSEDLERAREIKKEATADGFWKESDVKIVKEIEVA